MDYDINAQCQIDFLHSLVPLGSKETRIKDKHKKKPQQNITQNTQKST